MSYALRAERLALLSVNLSSTNILNHRAHGRHTKLPSLFAFRPSVPRQPTKELCARARGSAGDSRELWATTVAEPESARLERLNVVEDLLAERRVDAAFKQFAAQARQGRLPPDAICDELISRLCGKRRFAEARQAYHMMDLGMQGLQYNTFQALINACLSLGDVDTAIEIFRNLEAGGMAPNKVTYCGLISGLGKQRRRGSRSSELAYELWQELQAAMAVSGDILDAAALRTGMKACVDVDRIKEAESLLEATTRAAQNSTSAVLDVRTYNILVKGYAMRGDLASLNGVIDRMRAVNVRPSCVTYNILIDSHVRSGDLKEARASMKAATAAGIELDAWSYTSLMKGCVQAGDIAGAEQIFEEMRALGVKPTYFTYTTLIDGYARAGDLSAARLLLQRMIAAGEQPSAVTYNSLLRSYAASPQLDALRLALMLLDDMRHQEVAPAVDTFNTLMSAAVEANDPGLAVELFRRLRAAGLRPDGLTYTVLLQTHARLGQVSEAVAVFEALSRDSNAAMDITAYNAMVDAFARAGEMDAAEKMLQRACEFAKRTRLPPPVPAFGALVSGYSRLKLVAPAVATVRRLNAAGGTPDVQMMDQLVDLCVRTGEFRIAMQAVRSMELIGAKVDKEKYRTLVKRQMERAAAAEVRSSAKKQKRAAQKERVVYLERFKFWLGLPNSYYDTESEY